MNYIGDFRKERWGRQIGRWILFSFFFLLEPIYPMRKIPFTYFFPTFIIIDCVANYDLLRTILKKY